MSYVAKDVEKILWKIWHGIEDSDNLPSHYGYESARRLLDSLSDPKVIEYIKNWHFQNSLSIKEKNFKIFYWDSQNETR